MQTKFVSLTIYSQQNIHLKCSLSVPEGLLRFRNILHLRSIWPKSISPGVPLIDLVKSIASIWLLWCMATVLICCEFSALESVSFSLFPWVWLGFHLLALVLNKFTARVKALVNTLNCCTMQQFAYSWPTIWPQQMHWLIYLSHHASFPHGSCPRRQRGRDRERERGKEGEKRDSLLQQNATRDICMYHHFRQLFPVSPW